MIGIHNEIWFGDVVEILKGNGLVSQWGIFCGQADKLKIDGTCDRQIRYWPAVSVGDRAICIRAPKKGENILQGSHEADMTSVLCGYKGVRGLIHQHTPTGQREVHVYEYDNDSDTLVPVSREAFEKLLGTHPVRLNCALVGNNTPIRVVNLSFWQDGMSGSRTKKWNPHECSAISFAGLPHAITDKPSGVHIISVARDTSSTRLLEGVKEEIVHLQHGILVFDASTQKMTIVTGSLVQAKADNPAASSFASHSWKGNYPCRVCFYNAKKNEVLDVLEFRNVETSVEILLRMGKNHTQEGLK